MKSYHLTKFAESDLFDIWEYTFQQWGEAQANLYLDHLQKQCEGLTHGDVLIRSHDSWHPYLKSIPCQHHHIFFLHAKNKKPIILAFFYERMDFIQRLKKRL